MPSIRLDAAGLRPAEIRDAFLKEARKAHPPDSAMPFPEGPVAWFAEEFAKALANGHSNAALQQGVDGLEKFPLVRRALALKVQDVQHALIALCTTAVRGLS